MASFVNNLHTCLSSNVLCKAFGIKISNNSQVVLLAKNAGFDALFIDLEHGWLSLAETSNLCITGSLAGVTPFVRVPHQCGNGFVQRVLDGGAAGVIFPHIHSTRDAEAAVRISKYPPVGCRSMTGTQPAFNMKSVPFDKAVEAANHSSSTVIAMIESREGIHNIEQIAAVKGVDVLLIGSADLSIDLGVPGQFDSDVYRSAIERVSQACQKHGPAFGVAGVYDKPDLQSWMINTLGARFMLVHQDASAIASGAAKSVSALPPVQT